MGRVVWLLMLAMGSATCAKTWVLGPTEGAGGAGGAIAAGGGAPGGMPGGAPGSGGFPGSGGRGNSGTGGHGGATCSNMRVPFDIPTADMIFLVGRDSDMMMKFGDTTRMLAVQSALHQALMSSQYAVYFGYQDFPSLVACSNGSTCCPSALPVDPAPGSAASIDNALRMCAPNSSTSGCVAPNDSRPVSQALMSAMNLFADLSGDNYVVLMVDGPPGCPSEDATQACGEAQTAVSALNRSGVKTYVVAIGDAATSDPCLDQISLMGGMSAHASNATDPASLANALTPIVNSALSTSCTIELFQKPMDVTLISIFFQGRYIPRDVSGSGKSGWNYVPNSANERIQVYGSDCTSLQNLRSTDVSVWYGCPPCTDPSGECP